MNIAPAIREVAPEPAHLHVVRPTPDGAAAASLAPSIIAEHREAEHDMRSAVRHAIRCGELLIEAKAGLKHGEWEAWIEANLRFKASTVRGYMRLASLDPAKRQHVADLSLREALKGIGEEWSKKQKRIEIQAKQEAALESIAPSDGALRARAAHVLSPVSTKHANVEKVIDTATIAINRWFDRVTPHDRAHLSEAIQQIVAERAA